MDDEASEYDSANTITNVETDLPREEHKNEIVSVPDYEVVKLIIQIGIQELHLYPIGKLSAWIEEVVRIESPVHFDEMARRIVEGNGIAKVGSRIRETLVGATQHLHNNKRIKIKGDFLWLYDMEKPVIRSRSNLSASC